MTIAPKTLTATHPQGQYDIVVGADLLTRFREFVPLQGAVVVISDEHVAPLYAEKFGAVDQVIVVPAGEAHKNLDTIRYIYDSLLDNGFDRKTTLISLGGGVVGDMVGFAAATYLRGVNFVQCPTSLLAMVDASVGGKTGVDMPQGKNLIGAFKQPEAVLVDLLTLPSLPVREQRAGMAEVVKHGLLNDPALYERCRTLDMETWSKPLDATRLLEWQDLLFTAIQVKRDVVIDDPFEHGRRALLNLGHTFGHAIERVSRFEVNHGEAVAMGLTVAAEVSTRIEECEPELVGDIVNVLTGLGLPTRIPSSLSLDAIYQSMWTDKKKDRGLLNFVLLRRVGEAFKTDDVPVEIVKASLAARQATSALS